MAAAGLSSSWMHITEQVDENVLDVDKVAPGETYKRPQLRSSTTVDDKLEAMADHSRMSHVEAWIDRELFGDVVDGREIQCQDEGEMYITTLRKDVDEYIEMQLDYGAADVVSPAIGEDSQYYHHVQHDDSYLSPVESEYRGMYDDDEPRLWSFS